MLTNMPEKKRKAALGKLLGNALNQSGSPQHSAWVQRCRPRRRNAKGARQEGTLRHGEHTAPGPSPGAAPRGTDLATGRGGFAESCCCHWSPPPARPLPCASSPVPPAGVRRLQHTRGPHRGHRSRSHGWSALPLRWRPDVGLCCVGRERTRGRGSRPPPCSTAEHHSHALHAEKDTCAYVGSNRSSDVRSHVRPRVPSLRFQRRVGPASGLLPLTHVHLLSHSRTIVFLRRKPGLPRGQHQGWHLGSLMGVCPLFPTLVTPTWGLTDSGSRQPQTRRVINPAEQRDAQTATALPSRLEPCFPAKTQNETWHGSLVRISLSPSGSPRVSGKVSPCA